MTSFYIVISTEGIYALWVEILRGWREADKQDFSLALEMTRQQDMPLAIHHVKLCLSTARTVFAGIFT